MRRCPQSPEPENFDLQVRQPGNHWLAKNSDKPPKDFWSLCKPSLAQAFDHRCAYTAMRIPNGIGTTDHYRSKQHACQLSYEWSNYRYALGRVNGCKGTYDDRILDPFEVQNDWFRIQLPDLQLVLTDQIPLELRDKAEFTIKKLQLQNSEWVINQRAHYYDSYRSGEITLAYLEKIAPLIAAAVRKLEH